MQQQPHCTQSSKGTRRVPGASSTRVSSVIAVVLLLGACTDQPPTSPGDGQPHLDARGEKIAAMRRTASRELAEAARGRTARGAEDEILRLEAVVPGLGGVYVDSATGQITVFVRDAGSTGRAIAAVRALGARLDQKLPEARRLATHDATVRIGEFAFSELVGWSNTLASDLIRIPGFVSVDADERTNHVAVTISDIGRQREVESLAAAAGMPSAALMVRAGPPVVALSDIRSYTRPLAAGYEIRNGSGGRCTIGWDVSTPQGETGFLTAGHCSASGPGRGALGESIYQVTDFVGTVTLNPTWFTGCYTSATGGYFSGYCSEADVLFVATSSSDAQKRVAMTADVGTANARGSVQLAGHYNALSSAVFAWAGLEVDKTGRTTGATRGTVQGTCEAVLVTDPGGNYVITCGDRVSGAAVGKGDSGAPVYRLIGTGIYPLGVMFAGGPMTEFDFGDNTSYCSANCTYIYSPWTNVQNRLARTFDPQP